MPSSRIILPPRSRASGYIIDSTEKPVCMVSCCRSVERMDDLTANYLAGRRVIDKHADPGWNHNHDVDRLHLQFICMSEGRGGGGGGGYKS